MKPKFRQLLRMDGFHRRSVFFKLLVSNAVILLVPLITGLVLYAKVEQFITDSAKRYNLAMLGQLGQDMDARLKEVEQLVQQITLNPKLNMLLNDSGTPAEQDFRQIQFIRDYLERHKLMTSDFIYDYYLYFAGTDTVLKQGVKTDSRMFYRYYYRYEGMSYESWRDSMLTAYGQRKYWPAARLDRRPEAPAAAFEGDGSSSGQVITYVQPLPISATTDIGGSLVVLIEESKIREMIRQIESVGRSSVYILNREQELIMGPSGELAHKLRSMPQLRGISGLFDERVNGEDVMVSYTSSERTDWKYVSVMPTNLFLERVNQLKTTALWLFFVFLGAGAAAAYFIAYRNYAPLRLIVHAVTKGRSASPRLHHNEYEQLLETFEESLSEERNLRQIIHRQLPVIQANYLSRLIRGYADVSATTGEAAKLLDINFVSEHFAVLLVDIDDASGFVPDPDERQWASIRFIIANVMTELANERHCAYSIELDKDRLALLINLKPDRAEAGEEDIRIIAARLKEWTCTRCRLVITVAVSDIHRGMSEIRDCYAEALQAADGKMVRGPGQILHYSDIRRAERGFDYSIETEIRLMNLVKSGDFAEVEAILDRIYETNFRLKRIRPEIGQCLFFNLAGTLLKIMNASSIPNTEEMNRIFDSVKPILAGGTAESMHAKTKELFRSLTEAIREERSDRSQQLLAKVTEVVRDNLTNRSLGLAMVAERLGMSPQYLSTFFKKTYGENLTDYIGRQRIAYAKKLMADPTLTNNRIAELSGYSNDIVFIRAFKKIEGVTPGKYRDSLANN